MKRQPIPKHAIYVLACMIVVILAIKHQGDVRDGLLVGSAAALMLYVFLIAKTFWRRSFLCVAYVLFVILMTSGRQPAYMARERFRCVNRLETIGAALALYHDEFKSFPPPYLTDEEGNPETSWRELILPYLADDPSDGAKLYDCPGLTRRKWPLQGLRRHSIAPNTAYVAIVGQDAAWTENETRTYRDFLDGTQNTILVIEFEHSGIRWDEPKDLNVNELRASLDTNGASVLGSQHIAIVHALFADGSVKCIAVSDPPDVWRRLLLRNDGEPIPEEVFR